VTKNTNSFGERMLMIIGVYNSVASNYGTAALLFLKKLKKPEGTDIDRKKCQFN
jgi:hypothetical protein